MKVCIIGWYGTETIGDRAILAGLFSFINQVYNKFEIYLGSLYPFFTERTLKEDSPFWEEIIGGNFEIAIFNSRNCYELIDNIKKSDLVIMGGGPLMHIGDIYMIEYAFKMAKKMKKKTGLLGCGIGPLYKKEYRYSVSRIVKYSDLIILRDSASKETLIDLLKEFRISIDINSIYVSIDPAVECCIAFKKLGIPIRKNENIIVNLRSFPDGYSQNNINIFNKVFSLVKYLAKENYDKSILFLPMHYFYIGDDDRFFLNKVCNYIGSKNISVQNKNLSLVETLSGFQNAEMCIGMRFHSILIQTILNGNNYIIDYTDPINGKIISFLKDVDVSGFYLQRYSNIRGKELNFNFEKVDVFSYDPILINGKLNVYIEELKALVNENTYC